jgi:hypothetical protein
MQPISAIAQNATKRSMRIIALPLTRHPPVHQVQTNTAQPNQRAYIVTYYHFQLTSKPEGGLVNSLTAKVADLWAGFGRAPEGSWNVRLFLLQSGRGC